ncbi:MAG: hypothetical protein KC713_07120, partial [Candidatus Omnitrophica bacterium]|nr:hypothetical protein [Candidatus Omnitrophota bacterium]
HEYHVRSDFGHRLYARVIDELGEGYLPLAYEVVVGVYFNEFMEFYRNHREGNLFSLNRNDAAVLEAFKKSLGEVTIYRAITADHTILNTITNKGGGYTLKNRYQFRDDKYLYSSDYETLLLSHGLLGIREVFRIQFEHPNVRAYHRDLVYDPFISVAEDRGNGIPNVVYEATLWRGKGLPPEHKLYVFKATVPKADLIPAAWDGLKYFWRITHAKVDPDGDKFLIHYPVNEYYAQEISGPGVELVQVLDREALIRHMKKLEKTTKQNYEQAVKVYFQGEYYQRVQGLLARLMTLKNHLQEKDTLMNRDASRVRNSIDEYIAILQPDKIRLNDSFGLPAPGVFTAIESFVETIELEVFPSADRLRSFSPAQILDLIHAPLEIVTRETEASHQGTSDAGGILIRLNSFSLTQVFYYAWHLLMTGAIILTLISLKLISPDGWFIWDLTLVAGTLGMVVSAAWITKGIQPIHRTILVTVFSISQIGLLTWNVGMKLGWGTFLSSVASAYTIFSLEKLTNNMSGLLVMAMLAWFSWSIYKKIKTADRLPRETLIEDFWYQFIRHFEVKKIISDQAYKQYLWLFNVFIGTGAAVLFLEAAITGALVIHSTKNMFQVMLAYFTVSSMVGTPLRNLIAVSSHHKKDMPVGWFTFLNHFPLISLFAIPVEIFGWVLIRSFIFGKYFMMVLLKGEVEQYIREKTRTSVHPLTVPQGDVKNAGVNVFQINHEIIDGSSWWTLAGFAMRSLIRRFYNAFIRLHARQVANWGWIYHESWKAPENRLPDRDALYRSLLVSVEAINPKLVSQIDKRLKDGVENEPSLKSMTPMIFINIFDLFSVLKRHALRQQPINPVDGRRSTGIHGNPIVPAGAVSHAGQYVHGKQIPRFLNDEFLKNTFQALFSRSSSRISLPPTAFQNTKSHYSRPAEKLRTLSLKEWVVWIKTLFEKGRLPIANEINLRDVFIGDKNVGPQPVIQFSVIPLRQGDPDLWVFVGGSGRRVTRDMMDLATVHIFARYLNRGPMRIDVLADHVGNNRALKYIINSHTEKMVSLDQMKDLVWYGRLNTNFTRYLEQQINQSGQRADTLPS